MAYFFAGWQHNTKEIGFIASNNTSLYFVYLEV